MLFRHSHPAVSVFFKECLLDGLDLRLARDPIDSAVITRRDGYAENQRTLFFYEDSLCRLPRESGHSIAPSSAYRLNKLRDVPVILTGGGCGPLKPAFLPEFPTLDKSASAAYTPFRLLKLYFG